MKIIVPPIVRPLSLAEYAPEMKPAEGAALAVQVWVNPTRAVLDEFESLKERKAENKKRVDAAAPDDDLTPLIDEITAVGDAFAGWYAKVWSQHPDAATHWTLADVNALTDDSANPGLYKWLVRETWRMIREYRAAEKKS